MQALKEAWHVDALHKVLHLAVEEFSLANRLFLGSANWRSGLIEVLEYGYLSCCVHDFKTDLSWPDFEGGFDLDTQGASRFIGLIKVLGPGLNLDSSLFRLFALQQHALNALVLFSPFLHFSNPVLWLSLISLRLSHLARCRKEIQFAAFEGRVLQSVVLHRTD